MNKNKSVGNIIKLCDDILQTNDYTKLNNLKKRDYVTMFNKIIFDEKYYEISKHLLLNYFENLFTKEYDLYNYFNVACANKTYLKIAKLLLMPDVHITNNININHNNN